MPSWFVIWLPLTDTGSPPRSMTPVRPIVQDPHVSVFGPSWGRPRASSLAHPGAYLDGYNLYLEDHHRLSELM